MALILSELISPQHIIVGLAAKTATEAVRELIDSLNDSQVVLDNSELLEAVLDREAQISTGTELGFAIPHGKSRGVKDIAIAIGVSHEGIQWNSAAKPIHIVVLVCVPEDQIRQSLLLCSNLGLKLKNEDRRHAIMFARSPERVKDIFLIDTDSTF